MERTTRQKTAIQAAIESAQRPLSAQEILEQASLQVTQLGIATVYRNLKSLVLEEKVHVVTLPGENPRYESNTAANHHHHHFQCTTCQRVFDVHDCPGDLKRMAPQGFVVERHELTLYGRCADCNTAAGVTGAAAAKAKPAPHACASHHDPA
ncbi:Fur family transcriptional regulator [Janthinobacterium sp. NKUCC08_JDC]|uniref:Fur family transcriptional regulator n=1 Tax=Janthinobacterium sp. NKUCC08_JDC TaxID=2842122 RepID=UPI00214C6523|nr:transcriptional repressor [Janthinobacterium sp. NKUCC08_JDC]